MFVKGLVWDGFMVLFGDSLIVGIGGIMMGGGFGVFLWLIGFISDNFFVLKMVDVKGRIIWVN